jgi:hypothetical protein
MRSCQVFSDLPDTASVIAIHNDLANAKRIERNRREDAPVMSSLESDALSRAETLLAAVAGIVGVHEICRDEPWLSSLYSAWRVHGLDTDSVRPVAEIFTTLGEPIAKRLVMLSYAVTVPDNAHTDAELIAAVERASSGRRPFKVFRGNAKVRSRFEAIRISDKSP